MMLLLTRGLERFRRRFHPLHCVRGFPPARWILQRIDRPWQVKIDGISHPVSVWLGRNLGTVLSAGQAEEREERDLLVRLARANGCRVFWDVGANYGLFTFGLRASLPELSIEAFEPDPDYITLLRRTLRVGGLDRVRIVPVALSDREGTVPFRRDLTSGSTGSLRTPLPRPHHGTLDSNGDQRTINVVASTIDAECSRIGTPDLIKIDVEGAELEVLEGGKVTLEAHRPIILLECTHRQEEVRRLLEELGYEIRDPKSPTDRSPGPGMPFMALALDPGRHNLGEALGQREKPRAPTAW